jgi:hypothetical protein
MKKLVSVIVALTAISSSIAQVHTGIHLIDTSFNLSDGSTAITTSTPLLEVRWGTYAGSVFTPVGGVSAITENAGFLGDPFGDGFLTVEATLAYANNTVIAAGTPLALAITSIADDGNYSSSASQVILTDSSWVVPTFDAFAATALEAVFSASTVAVRGQYVFSAVGNDTLNFQSTVIPEPSTYAALAGVAVLGLAALRRRRA